MVNITLDKKVILITGASRGIGRATALLAAKNHYNVVINYHSNEKAAADTLKQVIALGSDAMMIKADISNEEQVIHMFKCIEDRYHRLDGLVNNAGILAPQMPLLNMSAERINQVLKVNVTGAFICAREAIKHMSTQSGGRGGSIVNVSSIAASLGAANEYIDYAASKGAIDTMTIGLAKEVAAHNIRVNAVRPGVIDTEIHASGGEANRIERVKEAIPFKRAGNADEVAQGILWLLSEQSSYTSGALLDIAGAR